MPISVFFTIVKPLQHHIYIVFVYGDSWHQFPKIHPTNSKEKYPTFPGDDLRISQA